MDNASLKPDQPVLQLVEISRSFTIKAGFLAEKKILRAVEDVSFQLMRGECLGLVGESGCGKSTLGRLCSGLLPPTSGQVLFLGRDLPEAGCGSWARGQIQMIFQDPFSSLNPRMTVGDSVAEPLLAQGVDAKVSQEQACAMLATVGLKDVERRYPHEFSGGQRQRIAVARALVTKPHIVICDEPVSALDASVQAQVLNLLCDMQEQFSPAYLFISHDLNVVGFMCQRILVMYLGRIVEAASRDAIFSDPRHPYTKALLAARGGKASTETILHGELPSPINQPLGCTFHPRCPKAVDICRQNLPPLKEVSPGWMVRCHLA
ncbi:MAG: ATP-binding cassette domain-containing protein [Desulfovibrionaceae bacterium]|nr:ATP-binding cassette domain-containing protein [Desulfovibrionaceae bacterium]